MVASAKWQNETEHLLGVLALFGKELLPAFNQAALPSPEPTRTKRRFSKSELGEHRTSVHCGWGCRLGGGRSTTHMQGHLTREAPSSVSHAMREEFLNYFTTSCLVLTIGFPNSDSFHPMTNYSLTQWMKLRHAEVDYFAQDNTTRK